MQDAPAALRTLGTSNDRLAPAIRLTEGLVPRDHVWAGAVGLRVAAGVVRSLAVAEEGIVRTKAAGLGRSGGRQGVEGEEEDARRLCHTRAC